MKVRAAAVILITLALFYGACQSEEKIEFNRYYSTGALLFQDHCQNCHDAAGEGLLALIPPLTDSTFIKTNKTQLACYLKNGLKGPIILNRKVFDDSMPSSNLSPIEIAEVLTYVGNSFGNKLGLVNDQMVQTDLANCK